MVGPCIGEDVLKSVFSEGRSFRALGSLALHGFVFFHVLEHDSPVALLTVVGSAAAMLDVRLVVFRSDVVHVTELALHLPLRAAHFLRRFKEEEEKEEEEEEEGEGEEGEEGEEEEKEVEGGRGGRMEGGRSRRCNSLQSISLL